MGSEKRILPAFLLCFTLGMFGAHRFYVGKIGTGLLQLFTLGGFGIWWLVDMIMIIVGGFKDREGEKLVDWT
jgi:TM2 domain-containing membrane protein YozV